MAQIPVHSIDDPCLAAYRELNHRNLTRHSGLFIAEGPKVVERLIASRFELVHLLAEAPAAEHYEPLIPRHVPIFVASRELLQETIGFNFHRGVLAAGRREPRPTIDSSLTAPGSDQRTIVVCHDVQDPTNLGSIIRSSAAFGCAAVVLGGRCADPFSRRVLRVSMGAALHLPLIESRDLAADLSALAAAQFDLVAAVLAPAAEPLTTASCGQRVAILVGNEGHGLGDQWSSQCHRRVTIPMQLGVDSLNVATATAVMLYHFCRGASRPDGDP